VDQKYKSGELEDGEYKAIVTILDKKKRKLGDFSDIEWKPITFDVILSYFPLFNVLTKDQIKKIKENSAEERYKKGDVLYRKGDKMEKIFLIISGFAEM